jgi:hypothetical protein
MNWLRTALVETAEQPGGETLATFQRSIDPEWIEEALRVTGTATLRKRRLPAEQVIWLVLGMALLRDRPIHDVVFKLDLAMPGRWTERIATSSIVEARRRLGPEPLQWLFQRSAKQWALHSAAKAPWRGLSVFAADGTTMRVPDSDDNREAFGLASGGHGRGDSGYPVARLVAVIAVRSHLLADVSIGSYTTPEHTLADKCLPVVPSDSITIVDKNFLAAKYLVGIQRGGENRHWLVRAKSSTTWRVVDELGKGDQLIEMTVTGDARRKDPSLPRKHFARVISYQHPGSKGPQRLLTSLLDSDAYPADELVALYHERWEIELAYDEIKTHLLEREETIRSRTSRGVNQELWGILLAYNLVRLDMQNIAEQANVPPTRISFVMATRYIRDEWSWCAVASPGSIPKKLQRMRANAAMFVLPPRRSTRRYPRAVKITVSKYPKKRRISAKKPGPDELPNSSAAGQ